MIAVLERYDGLLVALGLVWFLLGLYIGYYAGGWPHRDS